ncbi:hypothetical protein EJ08DRAFT_156410 [Tothia fuscella]|uniref:Uncharacterized protein n=1 Tax=Tothia fuscella TaxID=1048955 RepID=A0A9P4U566_9PEZI|nr:hypothetical protein EJ08DRAFT_156410 [Tothia fuscella]
MALHKNIKYEPTTDQLVDLRNILPLCSDLIPDVGTFVLNGQIPAEIHYLYALKTFEKTKNVFGDEIYAKQVVPAESATETEEDVDKNLKREACEKGVPAIHFPVEREHSPPISSVPSTTQSEDWATSSPMGVAGNTPDNASSLISRPANKVRKAFRNSLNSTSTHKSVSTVSYDDESLRCIPVGKETHPTSFFPTRFHLPRSMSSMTSQSSASLMTANSTTSTNVHNPEKKRRGPLMSLFRRNIKTKDHMSAVRRDPLSDTPSIAEVPELSSPESHQSQDLSSLQSLDLSARTSNSSFTDTRVYPVFGPKHMAILLGSRGFKNVEKIVHGELDAFVDFWQHQRVALPLILGRNCLWLLGRKQTNLERYTKAQEQARDDLDNKHASREFAEIQRLEEVQADFAIRNATALKHLQCRMSSLGDNVTRPELKRLNDETYAMEHLAKRHEHELEVFKRKQDREKLDLAREQQRELAAYTRNIDEKTEELRNIKLAALKDDTIKLAELVDERKYRLVARWFLRLQIVKMEIPELRDIKEPIPLRALEIEEPGFLDGLQLYGPQGSLQM